LTLGGCKSVAGRYNIVDSFFADKHSRKVECGLAPFNGRWIIQDARPIIVDAPLKLIFGGRSDIGTGIIAHRGGRYIDYGSMPMHSTLSVHDARPKIVDAPLTLIFGR